MRSSELMSTLSCLSLVMQVSNKLIKELFSAKITFLFSFYNFPHISVINVAVENCI